MDKKRLKKLAGVITESVISESIPQNVMNQKFKYVGKILQFDPNDEVIFNSLYDFFAVVRWGWDKGEAEAEKYINSLSYGISDTTSIGMIASDYDGEKKIELKSVKYQ